MSFKKCSLEVAETDLWYGLKVWKCVKIRSTLGLRWYVHAERTLMHCQLWIRKESQLHADFYLPVLVFVFLLPMWCSPWLVLSFWWVRMFCIDSIHCVSSWSWILLLCEKEHFIVYVNRPHWSPDNWKFCLNSIVIFLCVKLALCCPLRSGYHYSKKSL